MALQLEISCSKLAIVLAMPVSDVEAMFKRFLGLRNELFYHFKSSGLADATV